MKATKITNADITPLRVSSLPSRPTAPKAYGGLGYTAAQMKSAFDAFPMFLANKFNALMTDITATELKLLNKVEGTAPAEPQYQTPQYPVPAPPVEAEVIQDDLPF